MAAKMCIGLIGGGNMGSAILSGIYREHQVAVCETDPACRRKLKRQFHVALVDIEELCRSSRVIILAVKPQGFDQLLTHLAPYVRRTHVVVSIAAGLTTPYIEKRLPRNTRVVRTMPNLPAQVKMGVTGICAGRQATTRDVALVARIFRSVGTACILEERLMDAVTAVSGSGPAYVFLFIECWLKASRRLGLSKELSDQMVVDTLKGALALYGESTEDATTLKKRVTSKGGTTAAALDKFAQHKIEVIFWEALNAARLRAKELSR